MTTRMATRTTVGWFLLIILSHGAMVLAFVQNSNNNVIVKRPLFVTGSSSSSSLSSMNRLVQDIESSKEPKVVFVGGKGGVGKTTVSSALAVTLASQQQLKVLIVSTDPAHSLGDALDQDLRMMNHQGNKPSSSSSSNHVVQMTDPLTQGNLYACELDATVALQDFVQAMEAFDVSNLADALGVSADLLESLGLDEFRGLLRNPPPGLDELVALTNVVVQQDKNNDDDYDVIVVDTAPTGHTLRLLALPQFLDGLLGKLIKLRMKLSGLTSTLQAFLGNDQAKQRASTIDTALNKLEDFRVRIQALRSRLQNPDQTGFCIVSVPTQLSVAESKRLLTELTSQQVTVTDLIVNQCLAVNDNDDDDDDDQAERRKQYYTRRQQGQQRWIDELEKTSEKVSSTPEYQNNGSPGNISITKVPFFDVELVGVPALGFVGQQSFVDNPNFADLMETSSSAAGGKEPRVVICGGKGGVGKTTTSSALAVSMAAQGHNVALISTDPAHSLGDAIDMNLAGGELQDCPLIGVPPSTTGAAAGSLQVLEIDPTKSLSQFKSVVDDLLGRNGPSSSSSEIGAALRDFGDVFDTLPAGTDEVVALAQVVNLVKKGNFDRIVLDTAPTGHTLRMLGTPTFLADLIDRVLVLAQKVNSNAVAKMLVNSAAGGNAEEVESVGSAAKSKLLSFQLQMFDLEDLFSNPDQTEFLIVSVPTELAVRESVRLLNDLTFEAPDMPIKVRNIVVNQVLKDDGSDLETFLKRVSSGQSASIKSLEGAASSMKQPRAEVTTVPYLDTEPRGVYGLQMLANELLKES